MSIDRVSTASQTAYLLSQIQGASAQLDKTQTQIASGQNATTYAGFGDKAQVLTATLAAGARNTAYATATTIASTQVDLQDTQLSSLSDLAAQLKKARDTFVTELYDPFKVMGTIHYGASIDVPDPTVKKAL